MADKFSYGTYDPDIEDIVFTQANFPDPASETETRKQLSTPFKQLKDFINNTLFDGSGLIKKANLPTNDITTVKVNGTEVEIEENTVDITVPTQASDINAVPTARTINGNALSSNLSWAQLLPSVTSSDVGKVLQVNDSGTWVLQKPRLYPGPVGEGNDSTE